MWRRLKALLIKEFIQMGRDRLLFAMTIGIPVLQLLIFGFAINTDVKHLTTIVFDQSLSEESRDFLNSLTASEYFDVVGVAQNFDAVRDSIDAGRTKVGIIFPPDFSANLKHGRAAEVQILVDASDSMAASAAISTAQMLGQVKSQAVMVKQIAQTGVKNVNTAYDVRIRPWYNPDFISAYYMVPGILGIILTMTLVMITSMAIVRERENGTLEQLIVTPMRGYELMLGKIIPYVVMGYAQLTVALLVGILVFDLPVRGSIALLYGLTSLFIFASLSLGILISTVSQTQMQAMQLSFFVFMPSVLLSGFMFPRESMPQFFYYLGELFPVTFYMIIVRGVILKGIGLQYLWTAVFSLAVYILVVISVSIMKFKKTVA